MSGNNGGKRRSVRPANNGTISTKPSGGGLGSTVEKALTGRIFPFDKVDDDIDGVWPARQQENSSIYSKVIFFLSAAETIVMLVGMILAFVLSHTEQNFKLYVYNYFANFTHKPNHKKHYIESEVHKVGHNHVAYLLASVLAVHFIISLMKLVLFRKYRNGLIGGLSWPRAVASIPLALLTFALFNLLGNTDVASCVLAGVVAAAPLAFGCLIESFLLLSTRLAALRSFKLRKAGEGYEILNPQEITREDEVTNRVAGFFFVAMPWLLQIVTYLAIAGVAAGYFFTAVEKSDDGVPAFLWLAFIFYVAGQALAGLTTSVFYLNWYLSGPVPFFKNSFIPEVLVTVFNWIVFVGTVFALLGGLYHNY